MNVAKNVKVLALPPAVKYTNEKFIIEEVIRVFNVVSFVINKNLFNF